MTKKKALVTSASTLVAFIITLLLTVFSCSSDQHPNIDFDAIESLEAHSGISFPKEANWIGAASHEGIDFYFAGAIRLSSSELDLLLQKTAVKLSSTSRTVANNDFRAQWFDPDSAKIFRSGEVKYPDNHTDLKILIDKTPNQNSDQWKVYMIWFEIY